jgi:16S rRNA (guanine527-N7)-methyltransferase
MSPKSVGSIASLVYCSWPSRGAVRNEYATVLASETQVLRRGLGQLGLDDGALADQLEAYADLVATYNPRYRLVADTDRFVTHHLLDSVSAVAVLHELGTALRLMDVGSGAGLPGIPLALCLPDWQVTLVERSARRVRFLQLARQELPLPNCRIVASSLLQLGEGATEELQDVIAFRAVADANLLLHELGELGRRGVVVHQNSVVVAFKGRADRLAAELVGLQQPHSVRRMEVPFLTSPRHLVMFSGPWEGAKRRGPENTS